VPTSIALISDTHGYIGKDVLKHVSDVDEIWHAGDIGNDETAEQLENIGPTLRMVWGNIDGPSLRAKYPLEQVFIADGLKVYIIHIGGYPGRIYKKAKDTIIKERPQLYVCGHSHILKVIRDQKHHLLHMNPGACGVAGFHKFRTMLKFDIANGNIENLRAIELGIRGKVKMS